MLKLFSINDSVFDDEALFTRGLALVDEERRKKVNSLIDGRDKKACLSAGLILPLALAKCGLGGEVVTEREERGKPRLIKPEGTFFNLSHSGGYTIIALSDGEVGCDIQRIKPVDLKLAERYFHPEEAQEIYENGADALTLFFRYWCAKESYIKATGEGLSRPLNSFYIRFPQGEVCGKDGALTPWRVIESGEIEGYRIAVCTQTPQPITIEELVLKEDIL